PVIAGAGADSVSVAFHADESRGVGWSDFGDAGDVIRAIARVLQHVAGWVADAAIQQASSHVRDTLALQSSADALRCGILRVLPNCGRGLHDQYRYAVCFRGCMR